MSNIYNIVIKTPAEISRREGRPKRKHKDLLENMHFDNPLSKDDKISVPFEKRRLVLGYVFEIEQSPYSGSLAIIHRTKPNPRFPRFIKTYKKEKNQ